MDAVPPHLRRPGGSDLRRIAADLDHVRTLGGLSPRRLTSLRQAADVLREEADRFDTYTADLDAVHDAVTAAFARK